MHLEEGMRYLNLTDSGRRWIAGLHRATCSVRSTGTGSWVRTTVGLQRRASAIGDRDPRSRLGSGRRPGPSCRQFRCRQASREMLPGFRMTERPSPQIAQAEFRVDPDQA